MRIVSLLLVLSSLPALGATDERILIPINFAGPGGYGAQWSTRVLIENATALDIKQPGAQFRVICQADNGCIDDRINAGTFATLETFAPGGFVLHAPPPDSGGRSGRTYVSVRIAAVPRNVITGGTEIPIARESDFRQSLVFASVPSLTRGNGSRATIRLYSLDAPDGAIVRLIFRSQTFEAPFPFPATEVRLSRPPDVNVPAFAQIDLFDALRGRGPFGSLEIRCDDAPVWGLITLTDNLTNEVTALIAH